MKKILFLGTGTLGLVMASIGLGIREGSKGEEQLEAKINNLTKESKLRGREWDKKYSEIEKKIEVVITSNEGLLKEKREFLNQIHEYKETVANLNNIVESYRDEEKNISKVDKYELETYIDDSKLELFDLRNKVVFSDSMKDRDKALTEISNKFMDITKNLATCGYKKDTIIGYANELIQAFKDMDELVTVKINEFQTMDDEKELKDLIEATDEILLDILELKGKLALETDEAKISKIVKKIDAKIKYIRGEITKAGDLAKNEVITGMKDKLSSEEEFVKKVLDVKFKSK